MESEAVRRRIHKIAGHFLAPTNDDMISSTTHLLPMNCSSSLNSVIRRCDNRTYFARQASSSQACFMRQSSSEQSPCETSEAPLFARPSLPLKCSGFKNEGSCNASEATLFSRPVRMELHNANFALIQPPVQDCKLYAPDPPKFARAERRIGKKEQFHSKKKPYASESKGIGWSPRMDVRELACNYVMIIEIPGVGINDIRVEVDDQNLTVMAKRSAKSWKVTGGSNGSFSACHRREYREEPYKVVWPLPTDVNKETVSAEFLNGVLQIIIPKL